MLALSAAGYGAIALPSAALLTAFVGFLVFTRDSRAKHVAAGLANTDATVKGQAAFIDALQEQLDRHISQVTVADDRVRDCEAENEQMRERLGASAIEITTLKIEAIKMRHRLDQLAARLKESP